MNRNLVNYCWDQIISVGSNKEVARRVNGDLSEEFRINYLLENRASLNLSLLENVYDYLSMWIQSNVSILQQEQSERIVNLEFDRRFGWVVGGASGHKAYLGKVAVATADNVGLQIGHRSYISGDWLINGEGDVRIGSYSAIAQDLSIRLLRPHSVNYASLYGFDLEIRLASDGKTMPIELGRPAIGSQPVCIGSDVWIGRNVDINEDVTIGDGCVIGERSLLTKGTMTEPYGIYAGIPARKIRSRFSDDIINELLTLRWWDWPEEKIEKNEVLFSTDLTNYTSSIMDLVL